MTFPSYTFAMFFAVVLLVHRAPLGFGVRKGFLLVASYLFYAAWNPPFVALLWLSTVVDWVLARKIHEATSSATRKLLLVASLAVNLGLLAFFKYGGFFAENLVEVLGAAGWQLELAVPDVALPVGISFYTFQTLSYTIDVYRRQLTPSSSMLDYALYVTFFPQLVAGPIVRARDFLPQCEEERPASRDQLGWGFALLALGLFQKVVVADALLSPVVDAVYDAQAVGAVDAWLGTAAFAGQIFCDFSGYSTCAIGVALCLGFHLPDNFRAPYAAVGFSDFWRRWHISLSTWLRDYLYIPLGGSRHGAARTAFALAATMLLGGLWHGAAWTFVIWGALHGLYLVVERLLRKALAGKVDTRKLPTRLALTALTFALVCVAWVFFRAEGLGRALDVVSAMAGAGPAVAEAALPGWQRGLVVVVMALLLLAHQAIRERTLEEVAARASPTLRAIVVALLLLAVVLSPGSDRAFIYFQF